MFHCQTRGSRQLLTNKLTIHRTMNHLEFEDFYVVQFENVNRTRFDLLNKKILQHLLNVTIGPNKKANK